MKYDARNRANLDKLAPNTRRAAYAWYTFCLQNGIEILVYETIRTLETQKKYLASGASHTLKSYHLVGQALDFVPVGDVDHDGVKDDMDYTAYFRADIQKAVREAKRLGFEWGGDWKGGWDKPHLQYNYKGYGLDKQLDPVAIKGEEPMLAKATAQNIIDSFLAPAWGIHNAEYRKALEAGNKAAAAEAVKLRDWQNHLANELRDAAGIPRQ